MTAFLSPICDSLRESRRLDIEYLGTARASDLFIRGHERVRVEVSVNIALFELRQGYINAPYIAVSVTSRVVIKFAVAAQSFELFDIDASVNRRAVSLKALVSREYAAVFGYRTRAGEHKVCRALSDAGGGIDIAAVAPRARLLNETQSEIVLCDHLVGGGDIYYYIRAAERKDGSGRHRHPHILAQLNSDRSAVVRAEKHIAERHLLPTEGDGIARRIKSRDKVAFFIEFVVIRQIALRDNAHEPAVLERGGAIEEPAAHAHRESDYHERADIGTFKNESAERGLRAFDEPVLRKKIGAGIACYAQLRQGDYLRAGRSRPFYQRQHIINIFISRADRHPRADRRGLDKSEILQDITFPFANLIIQIIVYTNSRFKSILFIFRR